MEFYRCCHLLLNGHILTAPRFGTTTKGGGMLDFFVGGHKWGFELTRDGTALQNHWERFMTWGDILAMDTIGRAGRLDTQRLDTQRL